MQIFDNINRILRDDLEKTIVPESRLSIAAACFSIYAYNQLRMQLDAVSELRFIFTSPTFVAEKARKEKREFYIPRLNRERTLHGNEFEIKLRNELTQKAVARECAEWIRRKVVFKSNVTNENMAGFIHVAMPDAPASTYMPVSGFTTVDIGCERGDNAYYMVNKFGTPASDEYLRLFNTIWNDKAKVQEVTDEVIDCITAAYEENPPEFVYIVTLYNIFKEFLEDVSEDVLPNEATGFKKSRIWGKLYDFQRDATLAIINKLERYNGCILADSVGLGKTFTALAVIKYYEDRNKNVLVLCPKKLSANWNTFKANYVNNPVAADRLRYDVLFHTDLSRDGGESNGLELGRLNWGNYDLVVIDESHNFRNGGAGADDSENDSGAENRYTRLLNRVIRSGVKTKVLMLSATPVNTRLNDLKNQLALAYEGNPRLIDDKLDAKRSIDEIFRSAQRAFNEWSAMPPEERSTASLLELLDFDFFEVLDSVTIARSRKHIEKYYNMANIGKFPERLPPRSLHPPLTALPGAISYKEIFTRLMSLNLTIYTPTVHVFPSKKALYDKATDDAGKSGLTQTGREQGLQRLVAVNLLKRLESSVYSFGKTIGKIKELIEGAIARIDTYESNQSGGVFDTESAPATRDFDGDDVNTDFFSGGRQPVNLADMDWRTWRDELRQDAATLSELASTIAIITPEHDSKLQKLLEVIKEKVAAPLNPGNRKVLIFTAFADTAEYLYEHTAPFVKAQFGLDTAMITGGVDGRSTVQKLRADFNTVLTCFSPLSKEKALLMPGNAAEIDVLIGTDCISEGQNLQDCDFLINYDIHWNPVRIIQRFGRIDRIGSRNGCIQLVNFWPDLRLDEYIQLKERVETRMKVVFLTATATAGDNPINNESTAGQAESDGYREKQLKRLHEEVVDIEEMSTGISIMDLGLNEFRLDLLEYAKRHEDLDEVPFGMSAVAAASPDAPPGVVFILKNRHGSINADKQNRLHPFYLVYVRDDGTVLLNHLSPKEVLDKLRFLCKGKTKPIHSLCQKHNQKTKDGRDMRFYSELLGKAVKAVVQAKDQSQVDDFLGGDAVSLIGDGISGLDDFELICFLIVKESV